MLLDVLESRRADRELTEVPLSDDVGGDNRRLFHRAGRAIIFACVEAEEAFTRFGKQTGDKIRAYSNKLNPFEGSREKPQEWHSEDGVVFIYKFKSKISRFDSTYRSQSFLQLP